MQKCWFDPKGINSTRGGGEQGLQTAVFEERFDRDGAR